MALIDGNKFRKILHRYRCVDKVLGEVREYLSENYCPGEHVQIGRCLVTINDNSGRWLIPRRKDRYFDLAFTYGGIPGNMSYRRRIFIHLAYDAAEELTRNEFERRKEAQPGEEVLREAKRIINQSSMA